MGLYTCQGTAYCAAGMLTAANMANLDGAYVRIGLGSIRAEDTVTLDFKTNEVVHDISLDADGTWSTSFDSTTLWGGRDMDYLVSSCRRVGDPLTPSPPLEYDLILTLIVGPKFATLQFTDSPPSWDNNAVPFGQTYVQANHQLIGYAWAVDKAECPILGRVSVSDFTWPPTYTWISGGTGGLLSEVNAALYSVRFKGYGNALPYKNKYLSMLKSGDFVPALAGSDGITKDVWIVPPMYSGARTWWAGDADETGLAYRHECMAELPTAPDRWGWTGITAGVADCSRYDLSLRYGEVKEIAICPDPFGSVHAVLVI